jgi:hypothetical protein
MTLRPSSLSRLSLLLTVLLLAPRVGLAAGESPAPAQDVPSREASSPESSAPPSSPGQPSGPRLAPAQGPWAWQPQRPSQGVRILAETGAGVLTGAGGALGGMLAGGMLCALSLTSSSTDGSTACLNRFIGSILVGTNLGLALGTFWGGQAVGGNGNVLGPLAGAASGALAGVLVGTVRHDLHGGMLLGIPLGLIGSIIGYELTDKDPRAAIPAPAAALARPRVQPLLAVSSGGALLGLGGAF